LAGSKEPRLRKEKGQLPTGAALNFSERTAAFKTFSSKKSRAVFAAI